MILGGVALVLVILGVIGYFIWLNNEGSFLGVANYWNYLYASIPFSLLSACFMLFVIAAKDKS
jgi:hypothetical protein